MYRLNGRGSFLTFGLRGLIAGLAAIALCTGISAPRIIAAPGDARTLSVHNIHTKETLTVLYKKDGKHIPGAIEKLNWVMRDWRRNEATKMDPALFDLLWEIHTELGSQQPIHVISGYRSPATNAMLRKTTGGQAEKSKHILGQAADVQFPDVPLKRLRYSALIRERGGVGYYPTSATPFVHVDTGGVRHWPRMPRYELALLFPNGQSRHTPADGRPITREDVQTARANDKALAIQLAEFHAFRRQPKEPTLLADATPPPVPRPARAIFPAKQEPAHQFKSEWQVATLSQPQPPKLVAEPRVVERPSRFTPGPSPNDRSRLEDLTTLAAFVPANQPAKVAGVPATFSSNDRKQAVAANLTGGNPITEFLSRNEPSKPDARLAAIDPAALTGEKDKNANDADRFGWATGWVQAPSYDDEHPDELSYRPFPLAPLLTQSHSADDPILCKMHHPDIAKTLDMIDDEGAVQPMRFTPGEQIASLMWAQQFKGDAINLSKNFTPSEAQMPPPAGMTRRKVTTSAR